MLLRSNQFSVVVWFLFINCLLVGCGESNNLPVGSPDESPSFSITASTQSAEIETEFTLTWSVSDADSCSASGDWNGVKSNTGSEIITETEAGNKVYTLSCSGMEGDNSVSIGIEVTDGSYVLWDYSNIAYGTDDLGRQWLNIHLAYDQSQPSPVYLFAHANGGSANGMSEKQLHTIASEGYTTISWESVRTISTNEDTLLAFADAQVMFDWVLENASTYNLDPDSIVVGGRSRGSIVSWQLAHSSHPSIKGIYMYNALPKAVWKDTDSWSPVDEVSIESPPAFLVYGPDFDDEDGHNPIFVEPVIERYEELGNGDRITRYVDMWEDFQDEESNWTNDREIMHYFPEFVASLRESNDEGYNSLLVGHSFFRPVAEELPFHAETAGITGHSQVVEFSGGASGAPMSLWEDEEHRISIQTVLDTGEVELFGMTYEGTYPTTEGYILWIDYALSKNPDTKFFLALPWIDYPEDYATAAVYSELWHSQRDSGWLDLIDALRVLYPGVEIFSVPYGQAAVELRTLLEAGEVPEMTSLTGNNPADSLFKDYKGHGHEDGIVHELAELVWLNAIYGVDLDTYQYESDYSINLKEIAQQIMDQQDSDYKQSSKEPN